MQPDPGEAAISGDLSLQSHVLFQTESCPSKGESAPRGKAPDSGALVSSDGSATGPPCGLGLFLPP